LTSSGPCDRPEEQQEPGDVKGDKEVKARVLAVVVAFVSIWVLLAAGLTAVWLTEEVRVVGLVILPTAVVASLLVVYFDWRAKLQRRILAEREDRRDLAKAA
jgi:hypothetical protein